MQAACVLHTDAEQVPGAWIRYRFDGNNPFDRLLNYFPQKLIDDRNARNSGYSDTRQGRKNVFLPLFHLFSVTKAVSAFEGLVQDSISAAC